MKIATYNIENIFHRDRRLSEKSMGKNLSDWISELDSLMCKKSKTAHDQNRMRDLSFLLGFQEIDRNAYAVIRRKGGQLYFRRSKISGEKRANELTQWCGWMEIATLPINEISILNKARSIAEINPDILILQEIEDRGSWLQFNRELLEKHHSISFNYSMVFQGNDPRGLEMAALCKSGFKICSVNSHVNDTDDKGALLFDRDCPEYAITTPKGQEIWVLPNHFTGSSGSENADVRRKEQAERVAEIYERLRLEGKYDVVVCGTLNDVSFSDVLTPLLRCTDLKDISKHPTFEVDRDLGKDGSYHRLGAFRMGVNLKQQDYLLLSPNLFSKVIKAGLNRKGVWPERQSQWEIYNTIKEEGQASSSHPILWVEIED